eukprot:gene49738-60890_t
MTPPPNPPPLDLDANATEALRPSAREALLEALALGGCGSVKHVIVYQRTGGGVTHVSDRDIWLHDAAANVAADCPPEPMNAEDP